MSNKKNITKAKAKAKVDRISGKKAKAFELTAILAVLISFFVFVPSLQNDFVPNWDDGGYVLEYEPVQKINGENLAEIFSSFHKGNYHPLTTTVYAIIYAASADNPFLYHLVNLLLHCLNVLLVYLLIRRLFKEEMLAFWIALIFGIHPMHVESVAWISELKDVLYAFFYLLAIHSYLNFKENRKGLTYGISLLFFLLALASKSAAVTLPLVIILIDWLQKPKIEFRSILNKLPYLLLSLIFGIVAIMSQGKQGAIQDITPLYTAADRVFIVSYAILTYVIKFFAPYHLMAMYPYPAKVDGLFSWEVYGAAAALVVFLVLLIIHLRRSRIPVFGSLFFIFTSILTLQILPVGGAVVAERYTYIPYIGLSLIPVWLLTRKFPSKTQLLKWPHILLAAFAILLISITIPRISVWKNGLTLFTDVIEKNPSLPFAYNNRGYAYQKYYGDLDKALKDYSTAIRFDSTYYRSLSNRGVVHFNKGMAKEAILDFSKSLKYNPTNEDALLGRANSLGSLGQYEESIPDYDKYLELVKDNSEAWLWRGVALYNTGFFEKALSDISEGRRLDSSSDELAYWESLAAKSAGNPERALRAAEDALRLNPARSDASLVKGLIYYEQKKFVEAKDAFSLAIMINASYSPAYINRAAVQAAMGNYAAARDDLDKARRLGYPVDAVYYQEISNKALN